MTQRAGVTSVRVLLRGRGAERSYDVGIGRGLLGLSGEMVRGAVGQHPRRVCIVHDAALSMYHDEVQRSMRGAGFDVTSLAVAGEETAKSPEVLVKVLTALAEARLERVDPVIALGGGVVGDVAGFAAATYRRGIPVIPCPTTLLAMVDASVGGKTGINLTVGPPGGEVVLKNAVGAFHQPKLVIVDVDALATLPERHMRSGLAECVKHAMISRCVPVPDEGLWEFTRKFINREAAFRGLGFAELIRRNIAVKAGVVGADEREEAWQGGRALLNLGHTFAHAIETLPGLSDDGGAPFTPLHGEAVGLGLLGACRTAEVLGLCDPSVGRGVEEVLREVGLPTRVNGLPERRVLLERMAHDKKALGGVMRLVLPTGEGMAWVVENPHADAVAEGLGAIGNGGV